MGPYSQLCSQLFQAASRSNRFKDLKTYFFHNCVEEYLYTNPTLEEQYAVSTQNNQGFSGQDWLTPFQMPKDGLFGEWGQTYAIISAMFPLYPLTVQGLEQALKRLLVKN